MSPKYGRSKTKNPTGISEEVAAEIVAAIEKSGRRMNASSGARAFGVRGIGIGFDSSVIGDGGWGESQVFVMAPDADAPASALDSRRIAVVPILGDVRLDGEDAPIGSFREFAAGAEVAIANGGEDTAAFLVLTQEVAQPHADTSNGDETDDKLIPVVDVGKHRSDGAGEAETGEEE